MGKYAYIVDYQSGNADGAFNMYEGVFSTRKKANDYINEMIEFHIDEGYRLKEDNPPALPFDFLIRLVILTRRGRNYGTLKYRLIKLPIR